MDMTLKEYKTEKMKNPEFKKAYEKMKPEMETIRANIDKNTSFSPKKLVVTNKLFSFAKELIL
jgi:hypothetical protein